MVNGVYSVYDVVAEEFSPPFLAKNDGVAVRQVREQLISAKVSNAGDYEVYWLGLFNSETGELDYAKKKVAGVVEMFGDKPVNSKVMSSTAIGGKQTVDFAAIARGDYEQAV